MPRLFVVVLWALGRGCSRVVSYAIFEFTSPATQSPAPTAQSAQPTTLPPGYVGTDTCVTCHTDHEASLKGSSTGRRRIRDAGGGRAARAATVPGQAHVDDDAKGNILSSRR